MKITGRERWILIGTIVAAIIILKIITPEVYHGYDAGFYRAMARRPFAADPKTSTAPYSYRILAPWFIYLFPLPTETAFALYNTLLYGCSAYLLFFLILTATGSRLGAGLGVFFFLSSWVSLRFSLFYPVHIDGTYYFILILVLGFYSLLKKNDYLFLTALFLGALSREYFLALIPTYYFFRKEKGVFFDRAAARRSIGLGIGPVLLFLGLRILIPPSNREFSYFQHAFYFLRMASLYPGRLLHTYLNIYGAAVFILILHFRDCFRDLRKNPYLAVYLIISFLFLLVGGADRCRINFISFPAILICLALVIHRHRAVYRRPLMIGFLAAAQLFLMRIHRPMSTANWRQIWWSNVSFCPEDIFRGSLFIYGIVFLAFLIIYIGIYLKNFK